MVVDRRTEIPSWAYINAQIIQHAYHYGHLSASTRHVEETYQLSPNSLDIKNPAYLISLLYCLIVVPRELWLKDNAVPSMENLFSKSVLDLFVVSKKPANFDASPVLALLRHLRNALAHVRFSIDESNNFTFWDQESEKSSPYFHATISLDNMATFLSSVGATLANLRTKRGHPIP